MRIAVDTIPATGREVAVGAEDGWAVEAATGTLDVRPSSVAGRLEVSPPAQFARVGVAVELTVTATVPCDRCSEEVELRLDVRRQLLYAPEAEAEDGGERALLADELDLGWYTGGEIELGDVLREALALSLPSRIACTDTAGCDERTESLLAAHRGPVGAGHPGFAVLKDLT